jgi:hypothetical protein
MEATDYPTINKGTLEGFASHWGSGLAQLVLKNEINETVRIPCDSGPTGRALIAAFDCAAPGHSIDSSIFCGQVIYWWMDDMGLTLGGFVKEGDITPEFTEVYEAQQAAA